VKPNNAAQPLHGDIQLKMMAADRTGRTGNEASSYGERWRVGLRFTQPNLQKPLSKCHSVCPALVVIRPNNSVSPVVYAR
jgi:hypothetical protein